jgi:2-hydroxy-3-keto-5-methylthiopentenyl-1-phosphate phosphatase
MIPDMQLAILCDFDGTIITTDSAVHVFNEFVKGDWRKSNDQLERGEITLADCIENSS